MNAVNKIFPAPVLRIRELLGATEVEQATELALKANDRLNDHQVPYSRTYRDSLDFMYPEFFKPIFRRLRRHIEDEFKCNVSSMVGRESIFRYGQHLPFHTEPHADISCVLWLDFPAKPDPAKRDYSGMFCLHNPHLLFGGRASGVFGNINHMEMPAPGDAFVFPSHMPHFVFPYNGDRPGVELHFEMLAEAA